MLDFARGDLMEIWEWSFLMPFNTILTFPELLELPIFAPNDFFWNKYWDGKNKDDKWKVFARAIQEVMCEFGGFKMSDSQIDIDKEQYKKMVWGDSFKYD